MVEDDFKHQLSGLHKHSPVNLSTRVYAHLYTYVYIPQPKKRVEKGLNTEPNYHFYKTTYNEVLIKHLICWEDDSG